MNGNQHEFEAAGLGSAPFELHSYRRARDGATCQFCGTRIVHVYIIRGADGRTFEVGSQCVNRSGDRALRDAVARKAAEIKAADERARIDHALLRLRSDTIREALANVQSPTPEGKRRGESALEWCDWMCANSGPKGHLKLAAFMETIINEDNE